MYFTNMVLDQLILTYVIVGHKLHYIILSTCDPCTVYGQLPCAAVVVLVRV